MVRVNKGITLVEVLVSLFVLSIGLLGTAGLIIASMKQINDSNKHTHVVFLLSDMVDRMKANYAGVINGSYNNLTTIPKDPNCISTSCSVEQLAQYDLFSWNQKLSTELQNGYGTVQGNGQGSMFTITIYWDELGFDAQVTQKHLELRTYL